MPGLFYQPLSRKSFLKTTGALTAVTMLGGKLVADDKVERARIALFSDTHIPADSKNAYRGFRPTENLKKVVAQATESDFAAAIINGDAARLDGQREDYLSLKSLLGPLADKTPIHIGLGNHDDRKNFFKVFPTSEKSKVKGKHVSIFETAGTRFIILDSLMYVNKVAGLLGKYTREWLKDYLAESNQIPTLFFIHHTLGDGDGDLLDFEKFYDIVSPHKQVKAIFYGHSHRYHVGQRDHIFLINQPAIGYNFNNDQPVGWLDATFTPAGVKLTLQAVGGNVKEHGETKAIDWS